MVKRWTEGQSHFPGRAEGLSCEAESIPEHSLIMVTKKNYSRRMTAGSKKQQEPRLIGDVIDEVMKGWHRSTELCVDLKTYLRSDVVMKTGKEYQGVLRRDSDAEIEDFRCHDAHFTFTETQPWTTKRNPRLFNGKYISITRRSDGSLRPNFKPMKIDEHFSVNGYAFKVYLELLKALLGLVEEGCD